MIWTLAILFVGVYVAYAAGKAKKPWIGGAITSLIVALAALSFLSLIHI